ncbi:MAG: hypothetical protein JWO15_3129 [Sphingomonadales bacterium]|nr:hypothetical protein [Sphingomonadales bacterium]
MAQWVGEQGEPFDIAAISGMGVGGVGNRHASPVTDPYGFWASQELALTWTDDRAIVSAPRWDEASWDRRLALVQGALAVFACIPDAKASTLRWSFSGKTIARADADDLLARWSRDRAPPVMDLIEFVVDQRGGERWLHTKGLLALTGQEIEAMIGEDHAELARTVGRLAQEVLRNGPVTGSSITGPDGGKYHLHDLGNAGAANRMIQIFADYT